MSARARAGIALAGLLAAAPLTAAAADGGCVPQATSLRCLGTVLATRDQALAELARAAAPRRRPPPSWPAFWFDSGLLHGVSAARQSPPRFADLALLAPAARR